MKRACGVLLPVSSLPSKYGIGCFSKEAYQWIDQLKEAGQSYWQILPLTPTSYGDSPYQSFSSFAGNPYFIDLEELIEEGLLSAKECESIDWGGSSSYVDYDKQAEFRLELLKKAFEKDEVEKKEDYKEFIKENASWLEDYALYMAVKPCFEGVCWNEWAEDIRKRWDYSMEYYKTTYKEDVDFYKYIQYLFDRQWKKLKKYANDNGIEIVGDIPIYVAFDSADAWANPSLFQFDADNNPKAVAGCPPDAFAEDGQLWGNPLYAWDYHKNTGFDWWCKRMEHCFKMYDVVRIDHFRGFDEYYSVPYGAPNARGGHWEKGPGMDLFRAIEQRLGKKQIIAEDLGFLTPTVEQLLKDSGFPGMKVLAFAFDPSGKSGYLPHNFDRNSVVYTGTHDNETLVQWTTGMDEETKEFATRYLNNANTPEEEKYWDYIRLAMMSSSNTCIIQAQDLLGLGAEARMNFPSTVGNNWKWRIGTDMLPKAVMEKIYDMAIISDRLSYQCQHLEWLKKEEKKKALEEAKVKEEVNAKAKAKEVNGKESNKADSKTTVKEKSQEDKKTTAKEKSKEDKKEENEQLSFKWS